MKRFLQLSLIVLIVAFALLGLLAFTLPTYDLTLPGVLAAQLNMTIPAFGMLCVTLALVLLALLLITFRPKL